MMRGRLSPHALSVTIAVPFPRCQDSLLGNRKIADGSAIGSELPQLVGGEAINPARAAGGVERSLAAPLAHMHRIPGHVSAASAVRVTEHGASPLRWEVRIRLWQREAIRGPVAAGVVETVGI